MIVVVGTGGCGGRMSRCRMTGTSPARALCLRVRSAVTVLPGCHSDATGAELRPDSVV